MGLREKYPLHPRKVVKKTITESLGYIWMFGLVAAMASLAIGSWYPLLALPIIPLAIYLWQREYYKVYFYDSGENGLEIKKGVFFPNSITVPIEKISDVYVDQDLLDQLLGLYDLHFASASMSSGNLAHIDGLGKQAMEPLKAYLLSSLRGGKEVEGPASQSNPEEGSGQPAQESLATFRPSPVGLWLDFAGAVFGFAVFAYLFFPPLLVTIPILVIPIGLYVKKDYGTRIYVIRRDGLWLREGWLMPHETLLFYKNVQDLDVSQDIFERYFGLYTIRVKSMSYLSAMSARLRLLSAPDSARVQDMLRVQIELARAGEAIAKASQKSPGSSSAKPAPLPAYLGEQVKNPFKNRFVLGRVLSSLLLEAVLVIAAVLVALAAILFPGYVKAIIGGGAAMLFIFSGVLVAISAGLFILSMATGLLDSATYSYAIGREGLTVEFGLLGRIKKVIRYEKVQDIRLASGFVESFARLASLNVETGSRDIVQGGSSGSEASQRAFEQMTESIPYLSYENAFAFRSKILDIVGLSYPKSQVPLRSSIPLSHSKPLKKTVAYVGIFKIQLFIALVAIAFVSTPPASYLAILGAIILLVYLLSAIAVYVYEQVYMRKYFYDENGESLVIRKGVFGWAEIIVPFKNIQTIYLDQDWYDSFFGLWDVWITTVTDESGPMAHIDGVSREDAEKLARLLAKRVEESRKK